MASRSTVYRMVEAQLNEQGTSFEVLVPDLLDEGTSYQDITFLIRERTSVPIHEATVRRWVKKLEAAA